MNLSKFLELVRGGEKAHVDFKLTCNAFTSSAGDAEQAKAELVKDICAMANNGPTASFLIIGVSNDRKRVRPASDVKLTSEYVQSLIRESIHPRPVVQVHHVRWEKAPEPFTNADLVVIQIGPNAREAFRLNLDRINFQKKIHFRKNEVWIRNEDTSDLATPEQIVRMMGQRRKPQAEPDPGFIVTEYQKLPKGNAIHAMSKDAREFFGDLGMQISFVPDPEPRWLGGESQFRVRLVIRRKTFVFRCVFAEELSSAGCLTFFDHRWSGEHGILTFVGRRYSKAGKLRWLRVDFRTGWGAFALLDVTASARFNSFLPSGFAPVLVSSLTVPNLTDTKAMRERIAELLKSLESDDQLFAYLDDGRSGLNKELNRWSRKSASEMAKAFAGKRNERAPKEFIREAKAVLKLAKGLGR